MRKDQTAFLRRLLEEPSPSGYETRARRVWMERVEKFADEVRVDVMGNAIAAINPNGSPRLVIAGHIDEIGIMVKHIDDKGFLRFAGIGGWDPLVLVGQRVRIMGKEGDVRGVIGRVPIHLIEERDRKPPKIHELHIDIGAGSRKEAEKVLRIGDAGVLDVGVCELWGSRWTARGCDDRLGAFVAAEVARELAKRKGLKAAVFCVATVQEEVGLRGARTAAWGLEPDVGIAVDVTFATDQPGVQPGRVSDVKLGKGPVVCRGANINPRVFELLEKAAKRAKLKVQFDAYPGGTGTDANVIQLTRAGVATGLVSIPLRYMHTPIEVFDHSDLDGCVKLLTEFAMILEEGLDFRPV